MAAPAEESSLFLAQSEENRIRLLKIGAPEDRVLASGNLRFDVKATDERPLTALLRQRIPVEAKVVVAGSTLDGEEKALLRHGPASWKAEPEAILIVAPRRPERFSTVAALMEVAGFDVVRARRLRAGEELKGREKSFFWTQLEILLLCTRWVR